MQQFDVIIIGGGAAGFFTAAHLRELRPDLSIAILERGKEVMSKVRISGGGRCNVTHAQFDPRELAKNYPRGERELLGPFHKFMSGDTLGWFAERGVDIVAEEDGRMFPITNTSQTIIDCLWQESTRGENGAEVMTSQAVKAVQRKGKNWQVETKKTVLKCNNLVFCTGSSAAGWKILARLGHTIVAGVPSLFTFNLEDKDICALAGVAVECSVSVPALDLESEGPLLITHWGFSGPCILRMSAWGAEKLHQAGYSFELVINWTEYLKAGDILERLKKKRDESTRKLVNDPFIHLPKRLWQHLTSSIGLEDQVWSQMSNAQLGSLSRKLTEDTYKINGKSTFKEEFVTAGGVQLNEVDFRTFASKKQPNLYLAGEVLNIDAITGGFNFQNCWTGAHLVARSITSS